MIELMRVDVIELVRVEAANMVLLTVEISVFVTVVVPKEEFRFVVGDSTTDWTGHAGPVAAMQKDWSFGRTSHGKVMDGFHCWKSIKERSNSVLMRSHVHVPSLSSHHWQYMEVLGS